MVKGRDGDLTGSVGCDLQWHLLFYTEKGEKEVAIVEGATCLNVSACFAFLHSCISTRSSYLVGKNCPYHFDHSLHFLTYMKSMKRFGRLHCNWGGKIKNIFHQSRLE